MMIILGLRLREKLVLQLDFITENMLVSTRKRLFYIFHMFIPLKHVEIHEPVLEHIENT